MKNGSAKDIKTLQHLLNAGCAHKFNTMLFGKRYAWMVDPAGTWFLQTLPELPASRSYGPFTVDNHGHQSEIHN